MGHKVHAYGFRVGTTMDWFNSWYGNKKTYSSFVKIYQDIERAWAKLVPQNTYANYKIQITGSEVLMVVNTHKPHILIGSKGSKVNQLQADLTRIIGKKVSVKINEIKPEITPEVICEAMKEALMAKKDHKFIMKNCGKNAMQNGCLGIKMKCAGRLRGATIARTDKKKFGSIPLQTLDCEIAVSQKQVHTKSGSCGVECIIAYKKRS